MTSMNIQTKNSYQIASDFNGLISRLQVVAIVTTETPYRVLLSDGDSVSLNELTVEHPYYEQLEPSAQSFLETVRKVFS